MTTTTLQPRRLVARALLRREVAERERRLGGVVRRLLRELRETLALEELQVGSLGAEIHPTMERALERVWERHTAALVAALAEPVRLERADPLGAALGIEELARRAIGDLITEIGPKQLLAVRRQLAALMELGPRPEILQAIGRATGLTTRQTEAVQRLLARRLQAGDSRAAAARAAGAYADRLQQQRAATIARHEAVTFTNQLVLERGAAVAAGGKVITKQSVSARDERVDSGNPRGICAVLDDGRRIPLRESFHFEGRTFDGPPYHVGCRCLLELWTEAA